MSSHSLQSRLSAITGASIVDQVLHENLRIFTPDLQEGAIPDLADRKSHKAVRELIDDAELVIVDNLSCLARSGGSENESDSWNVLSDWALGLRREGISVLFLHHSGKSGLQRGTSRKEDILNIVINLKHPSDYTPDMGAVFEIHFEKGRELFGESSKPFLAKLTSEDEVHSWEVSDLESRVFDQVIAFFNLNMSPSDIAAELGINKSTVSRHLKQAREGGLVKKT
jgi:DNA-binding transcriptional ArsR family regulator